MVITTIALFVHLYSDDIEMRMIGFLFGALIKKYWDGSDQQR